MAASRQMKASPEKHAKGSARGPRAAAPQVKGETRLCVTWAPISASDVLDVPPSLGSKPVPVKVQLKQPTPPESDSLAAALCELYRRAECCDVEILSGGRRFPCHRCVLAASSPIFAEGLRGATAIPGARQEVRLMEVSNPEAVLHMLNFIYEVSPTESSWKSMEMLEINKDVLRLARRFQLPGLAQRAGQWLVKSLTTGNAVERLAICAEFGLDALKDSIIRQLAANRTALHEVANSPQIMEHPDLMRSILQATAESSAGKIKDEPPARKRARR